MPLPSSASRRCACYCTMQMGGTNVTAQTVTAQTWESRTERGSLRPHSRNKIDANLYIRWRKWIKARRH